MAISVPKDAHSEVKNAVGYAIWGVVVVRDVKLFSAGQIEMESLNNG